MEVEEIKMTTRYWIMIFLIELGFVGGLAYTKGWIDGWKRATK